MFHRERSSFHSQPGNAPQVAPVEEEAPLFNRAVMEQTAVSRHTAPVIQYGAGTAPANENITGPVLFDQYCYTDDGQPQEQEVQTQEQPLEEDIKDMNASENQAQDAKQNSENASGQGAPGNRVDIPGGAFQRPGQPMPGRGIPGAYPGAYPGSSVGAATGYTSNANDIASRGRKLIIGQGITLSGEIEACEHLIVEGTVEAALKGASVLEIAETGAFYGTVEISEATVAGRFEGDLTVKGRLTIRSGGSITGAIAYKELAVEAGATLDGKVTPLEASKNQNAGNRKVVDSRSGSMKKPGDSGSELPFTDKSAVAG